MEGANEANGNKSIGAQTPRRCHAHRGSVAASSWHEWVFGLQAALIRECDPWASAQVEQRPWSVEENAAVFLESVRFILDERSEEVRERAGSCFGFRNPIGGNELKGKRFGS